MGDLDIAADMKRDLPVPTGHIQKPVRKVDAAVMLSRRPSVITDGAMNVVVASFGGSSFFLGLLLTRKPRGLPLVLKPDMGIRTSLLYLINLSTAFTLLDIFQPLSIAELFLYMNHVVCTVGSIPVEC